MAKHLSPLSAVLGAGLIAATDLVTKAQVVDRLAYGQQVELLPSLNIVHVINQGAAFGLLATAGGWQRYLFIVVAVLASVLIIQMIRKPATTATERAALALILGGAIGNLVDRTARMGVVDWIDLYAGTYHWPAFNIADIGITVGAAVIVLHALFGSSSAASTPDKT